MIVKGSARRGAVDLALHLSNSLDNERVEVRSVIGVVSDNLYDAFREWELIADQSNAKNSFYSLSINPDPMQRDLNEDEWAEAIEHIEAKLGLTGQPRAVVFHHKVGMSDGEERTHCHLVWSRIKIEDGKLRAISDSHDYYKLRDATKELARRFNLELRRGRRSGDSFDHAKSHGKNRDPETAKERKEILTKLWKQHQDPKVCAVAMNNAGYIIAQGNRRSFVLVDRNGQIHALARQIDGVKTKDVRTRLGDAQDYPTIEQAKDEQRIREMAATQEERQPHRKRVDLTKEQKLMSKLKRMARRADKLKDQRRKKLSRELKETAERHAQEREWSERRYRAKTAKAINQRDLTKATGLAKYLRTAIGYEMLLKWKYAQQDRDRVREHTNSKERMKNAQAEELERIKRQEVILQKLEKREAKSFERLAKKLSMRKEQIREMVLKEDRKRLQKEKERSHTLELSF